LLSAPAGFRLVEEENAGFFSAWEVGRYGRVRDLHQESFVKLLGMQADGVFDRLSYELAFERSKLCVQATLCGDLLRFSVELNWREESAEGKPVPQLQLYVPYAYPADCIRYDAAVGPIDRKEADHDVPALLYAAPVGSDGGLMLTTDCKYGYRAVDNAMMISLIRSSHSPDKLPEIGVHSMELGIAAIPDFEPETLDRHAFCFAHPVYVHSARLHKGRLPQTGSLLKLSGHARVTALKPVKDGKRLLIRMVQSGKDAQTVTLAPVAEAALTDVPENIIKTLPVKGRQATVDLPAHTLQSVLMTIRSRKE
jgi:alpha-mannosidase